MKCPRCSGFSTSKHCGSCGWRESDQMPTDRHEEIRGEVLSYLKLHRPDLAELFESGQTVQEFSAALVTAAKDAGSAESGSKPAPAVVNVVSLTPGEKPDFSKSSEPEPEADRGQRFVKLYPCGCTAGPGPENMPDYCPDHGDPQDTKECQTVPFVEQPPADAAEK